MSTPIRPILSADRPSRRRFLDWFLGTSAGAVVVSVLYPVLRFVSPPDVPEASTNQLEAGPENDPELLDKGYKILRFGAEPILLVRVGEGEFRAFTATCTHLDCVVEYHKAGKQIVCNCHNGQYDLSGKNVGGPPPRPLTPFKVHRVARAGQPATLIVSRA